MFPRNPGASQAELEAAHARYVRELRALARELEIPAAAAEELIDDALHAALALKSDVDLDKWLAASLRAAAKRLAERGA